METMNQTSLKEKMTNLGLCRVIMNSEGQDYLKTMVEEIIQEIISINGDFVTNDSIKLINSL
jgi:predicted DNA-binding protein with PD1-like motif